MVKPSALWLRPSPFSISGCRPNSPLQITFSRWTDETISLSYQDYEDYGNAYVEEELLKFFYKRPYSGKVYIESMTFEGPIAPGELPGSGLLSELPLPKRNQDEWARRVLRQFATRAFRQMPDAKKLASIEAFYTAGRQRGDDYKSSLKDALTAVLFARVHLSLRFHG